MCNMRTSSSVLQLGFGCNLHGGLLQLPCTAKQVRASGQQH
jgi:hypothetical protein